MDPYTRIHVLGNDIVGNLENDMVLIKNPRRGCVILFGLSILVENTTFDRILHV